MGKKMGRAALKAAIAAARRDGDVATADRLAAELRARDDTDTTTTAMLATVIATM